MLVELDGFGDLLIGEHPASGGDSSPLEVAASRSAIDRERGGEVFEGEPVLVRGDEHIDFGLG